MTATIWKFRTLYFAFGLTMGVFFPYLAVLLENDGLSSETVGILVSVAILASMLAQPLWGILGDRYHAARLIIAAVFLVPAFFVVLFNARSVGILALVTAFMFIMKGPQVSVANAYTLHAAEGMGPAFGRIRFFQSVGYGIGGYLAGFYLIRFDLGLLWILFAALSVVSALTLLFLPPMAAQPVNRPAGPGTLKSLRALLSDNHGHFLLFLLGSLLVNQTLAAFNTYLAVVFRDDGGSIPTLGWAILIASVGNMVTMTAAERLTKRFGTVPILLVASLLYALRWGIQYFVTNPTWIIVIQILHCSFGLFLVPAVRYVDAMSGPEVRVTSQALFAMIAGTMGLSAIIGNALEGYLLHIGGPQAMYGVSALSAVAGTMCFAYIIARGRDRRRKAPSTFAA